MNGRSTAPVCPIRVAARFDADRRIDRSRALFDRESPVCAFFGDLSVEIQRYMLVPKVRAFLLSYVD